MVTQLSFISLFRRSHLFIGLLSNTLSFLEENLIPSTVFLPNYFHYVQVFYLVRFLEGLLYDLFYVFLPHYLKFDFGIFLVLYSYFNVNSPISSPKYYIELIMLHETKKYIFWQFGTFWIFSCFFFCLEKDYRLSNSFL